MGREDRIRGIGGDMDRSVTEHPTPQFAVIGHPNKGKSSIVAALAQDDTVAISNVPGTTREQKRYPFVVDGKVLYELIDTPGFQRARGVLSWLKAHAVSAAKRHEVVRKFIQEHQNDPRYHDEIALLTPIVEGAGILYVVDASKPYGEEYEAEMEILLWTGQPSMALLNHIDEEDYAQEWKRALHHYFKSIRTFNPMEVDTAKQIAILESMAQLREEWTAPIKASIALFQRYEREKIEESAGVIADLILSVHRYQERLTIEGEEATDQERQEVEQRYQSHLRALESQAHAKLEQIWHHNHLKVEEAPLLFESMDLFSESSTDIFGLTRKEMMLTAATTGAVTGAGIDLLFAGHTMFVGGAIGAVVGGAGAYFGFDELSNIKVLGQKLGRRYLQAGPMTNRNFPYILLGRALYLTHQLAHRSHARRDTMHLELNSDFKAGWLTPQRQRALEKHHKRFRSDKEPTPEALQGYHQILTESLEGLIGVE